MTAPQDSVAAMGLTKAQYIQLADDFRLKAQQAHDDARSWRNRALILTAQIAVLRSAYEPNKTLETER